MAITLNDVLGRHDAALDIRWECTRLSTMSLGFGKTLLTYVEGVTLPFPSHDSDNFLRGGIYEYYIGVQSITSATFTFYEDEKYSVSKLLNGWRNLIRDPESGAYGIPHETKGSATIILKDSTGRTSASAKLIGMTPINLNPVEYKSGQANRISLVQEFSVDGIELDFK